ncbi:MAG: oxidoreductase [Porphyrobacter sp.]|nr:oxidoreductase [Porphyrobacter sp.]
MPVAIVTGASSGIGKATAEALARAGYRVYGTSRKGGAASGGVTMLACEVTDQASVDALIARVLDEAGRVDLLVNNAGIGLIGGAEESSLAQVQALFDVNFYGAVRMINAVLPVMRRQGAGRILNVSSALGIAAGPYLAHYSASKYALEGYSEALDHEVRGFGVRVSLVEPAYTRTSMEANSSQGDRPLPEYAEISAQMYALNAEFLEKGDDPSVVADTIVRAAQDAAPRIRYPAGKVAKQISLLRRILPASMFDKALRKNLGLPA